MEGNNIVFNLSITIAPVSEVQLALFGSRNENLVATQGGPSTSGEFPGLYQPYPPLPPSSPAPKPPSSPAPKSPKPRFGQTEPQDPIWKRRNAKPIPNLELDPVICGDMNWLHNVSGDSQIFELGKLHSFKKRILLPEINAHFVAEMQVLAIIILKC